MIATVLFAAALTSAQIHAIDSDVQKSMAERHISSVVLRIDVDGKNVYARAFGVRDVADRLPANLQTRYQYGSVTKQFTGAAILSLVGDHKLSLDDRVGKWLPAFAKFPVTIRQLLVHTSGIADYSNEAWYLRDDFSNAAATAESGLAWAAKQPLQFTPGSKAVYDNTAYVMLARIVEKASGKPYFTFLSERFLKPLGMTSVAPQNFFRIEPDTALGYGILTDPLFYKTFPTMPRTGGLIRSIPWNMETVDGAGFLVGDAADLQKWDNALLMHRVFAPQVEPLFYEAGMLNNGKPTYTGPENPAHEPGVYLQGGLGRFKLDGVTIYGANGGTPGFQSFTATIPAKHLSITTLTNHGTDIDNSKLTMPILHTLLAH